MAEAPFDRLPATHHSNRPGSVGELTGIELAGKLLATARDGNPRKSHELNS